MNVNVDREGCIGCGLCAGTCPEVFEMDDENLSKVIVDSIPPESMAGVEEAIENCPVAVITIS